MELFTGSPYSPGPRGEWERFHDRQIRNERIDQARHRFVPSLGGTSLFYVVFFCILLALAAWKIHSTTNRVIQELGGRSSSNNDLAIRHSNVRSFIADS